MKTINNNAPVVCKNTISIKASPQQVWSLLSDINKWPQWQTDIDNAVLHGTLKPQSNFIWKSSGVKIRSTLHTVHPNKHLGWTGKSVGMYAVHNWCLTKKDDETIVEVKESMEGWLVRIFKKTMTKNLKK